MLVTIRGKRWRLLFRRFRDAEAYWDDLCRLNPKLLDSSRLTLSIDSFRRVVERAYLQGRSDEENAMHDEPSTFEALFGSFGKHPKKDQL